MLWCYVVLLRPVCVLCGVLCVVSDVVLCSAFGLTCLCRVVFFVLFLMCCVVLLCCALALACVCCVVFFVFLMCCVVVCFVLCFCCLVV